MYLDDNILLCFARMFFRKRQIIMRLDTRLLQPFTSWSNSL